MTRPLSALAALLTAVAFLSACGSEDSKPTPDEEAAAKDAEYAKSIEEEPGPKVQIPESEPPKDLVTEDIKIGKGPAAKMGDTVTLNYVGINWIGKKYANSWSYPEPPVFILGTGRLPRGFEEGIIGMKAGGRREVIVPPSLIFRPGIKSTIDDPDSTVFFIVEMLKVQ